MAGKGAMKKHSPHNRNPHLRSGINPCIAMHTQVGTAWLNTQ